jgi:hypothetical protein
MDSWTQSIFPHPATGWGRIGNQGAFPFEPARPGMLLKGIVF